MDTVEAAIEAEIDLDGQALAQEQELRTRRGEESAKLGKGGVTSHERRIAESASEQTPLLPRDRRASDDGEQEGEDRRPSWSGSFDFAHLPWYNRPAIFWVIGPFFIMACAFGGIIAPKMNLILDLICRQYISERMATEPGFTMAPVDFNGGANDQCSIPEVSARTSMFNLWGSVISGLLSAITAPKLGALSDRYGRKPILIIGSLGTIAGEIITIFAATYPATFPVPLMLLSYAFDGLTGSFIVLMSIANSYATDCTPPSMRNVAFGYLHGCLFTGLALGPIVAGYLVKLTGKIVIVFYLLGGVHLVFITFMAFVVPESLSKKRQQLALEKHDFLSSQRDPNRDWISQLRAFNLLEPLGILRPTGPGSSAALRSNLIVLAAVDTIAFGVAMGSMSVIIIYMRQQFHWESFGSGVYMTVVNTARVVGLIVILPIITRIFRGKSDRKNTANTGADGFDLAIIRFAIFFDTLGYLGYTLSRSGGPFILSGVISAIGGIGSPTLQSALTNSVPADRTGQLLGATGLLHALARVVAPAVFSAIFAATVGKYDQTVFVCLCSTFGLAFVVSWFLKPGVYYDEDKAESGEGEEEAHAVESTPNAVRRIPIVSAVTKAAGSLFRSR